MKAASFAYHDPASVEEVVSLLGSLDDAKLLAGGQSLVPMMNMRFVQPADVISLNGIRGICEISRGIGKIVIGTMVRQSTLARSEVIASELPVLVDALAHVGHFQTRNRGTIGGSLCHLDPAAEIPLVAALHDGEITVRGPSGERIISFADWPLAYMTPSLAPDEMMTEVALVPWGEPHGHGFVEFSRRHGDFAIVAVGALLALDGSGTISRAALAVAGADQVVHRLGDVEAALAGEAASAETFARAGELAATMETMDDAYVSAGYRTRLVRALTRRALEQAAARARGEGA